MAENENKKDLFDVSNDEPIRVVEPIERERTAVDKAEDKAKNIARRINPFKKKKTTDDKDDKPLVRKRSTYKAPISGYEFTPSYIKAVDRYATIVKISNNYGQNRGLEYGWVASRLIPRLQAKGIKAYLIETDKPMTEQEQLDIMSKNVEKNRQATSNPDNVFKNESTHDMRVRALRQKDLDHASDLAGRELPIIDVRFLIMLVSKDPDLIKQQLTLLQEHFDERVKGIKLTSAGGQQRELLERLLAEPEPDIYNETYMSKEFAGTDHMLRKGLTDKKGWAIGSLVYSMASGQALMDLNGSFDSINNTNRTGMITVASSDNSVVNGFSEQYTASSLWGQLIANNVMANGHRVYHIVLNNFRYEPNSRSGSGQNSNGKFVANEGIEKLIKRTDLSKGGINPLQMFGKIENLSSIYSTGLSRISMIFNLMSNRSLSSDELSMLREALNQFYLENNLWTKDAHHNPEKTRILNIKKPENYPFAGQLVGKLGNYVLQASNQTQIDSEIQSSKTLERTLKNALDEHTSIFNEPTSLPNEHDLRYLQQYFELGNLRKQPDILEAQFLNTFDYITSNLQPNDVVMIHGMDRISVDIAQYISQSIEHLKEDKIRFAFLFDVVGGLNFNLEQPTKPTDKLDIFNAERILYRNFERGFDFSILGLMNEDELEAYEKIIGGSGISPNLRNNLVEGARNQFQIRRPYDGTSNLVGAEFII